MFEKSWINKRRLYTLCAPLVAPIQYTDTVGDNQSFTWNFLKNQKPILFWKCYETLHWSDYRIFKTIHSAECISSSIHHEFGLELTFQLLLVYTYMACPTGNAEFYMRTWYRFAVQRIRISHFFYSWMELKRNYSSVESDPRSFLFGKQIPV